MRIVAPVTYARDSLEAAAYAAGLAAALGAELVLAGIAPAPEEPLRRAEEQRLLDRIVTERLDELAGELSDDVRCSTLLTWGPVGWALIQAAREQQADLIVVPPSVLEAALR